MPAATAFTHQVVDVPPVVVIESGRVSPPVMSRIPLDGVRLVMRGAEVFVVFVKGAVAMSESGIRLLTAEGGDYVPGRIGFNHFGNSDGE